MKSKIGKVTNDMNTINNFKANISFGAALTSKQEKDFKKVTNEAMQALGIDNGIHLYKVFQSSLPSDKGQNIGIGKLNSDVALEYLKFMALYTGSNAIKIYPTGEMPSKLRYKSFYCPYERGSIAPGNDNINFYKLTEKSYGCILTKADIDAFRVSDDSEAVCFENELDTQSGADTVLIRKAYNNMMKLNTQETKSLREKFEKFKDNQNDTYDRLALASYIRNEDESFFVGFENSKEKQGKFEEYKKKYHTEVEIYKFGKFLALQHLQEAKRKLNESGLELYGDIPLGFSDDEVFCFPDAFYPKHISSGWGFRSINFEQIPVENSPANRLFKEKISWMLENFDGVRFDVGWLLFKTRLYNLQNNSEFSIDTKSKIVEIVEKTAKKIKGYDYDTRKILYECVIKDIFSVFDWSGKEPQVHDFLKGRTTLLTTVFEHTNGCGWGSPKMFEHYGLKDYIVGTSNHDSTPLRALAENAEDEKDGEVFNLVQARGNNISALCDSLNLKSKWLQNSFNFIRAKFAELFLAKNHFVFFNDVTCNKDRVDKGSANPQNYRYKIKDTYESEYHNALQNGYGFNLADCLRLAMRAKGLDLSNEQLYNKLCYYSNLLYKKGPKTKQEAEKISK